MRAMLKALRDEVCPEHRPAAEEEFARLQADTAASSDAADLADSCGPGARAAQPMITRSGPRRRLRLRLAAAAAGGLLAAGMIVLAAAAASGGSDSGPVSGAAATGAAADRTSPGEPALARARQGTATTLASRANPSVAGGPVTFAALVRPATGGGTVAFTDGTAPVPGCGAQLVDNTGTATCQAAYPSTGTHAITAAYSGNAWYSASTSAALTQQVAYRVQLLDSPAPSGITGSAVLVRIVLLDAAGTNVSGPGITVTVTGLSPSPFPGTAPGGTLTAVNLGLWPCYQLNINTAGYPAGSYTLSFAAGSDPTTHTAQFVVP
jgi:Bacterial Ig-like domain (group 3)